jgi:hypothetical protein
LGGGGGGGVILKKNLKKFWKNYSLKNQKQNKKKIYSPKKK